MKNNKSNLMSALPVRIAAFCFAVMMCCMMSVGTYGQTTLTTNHANNNGSSVTIFSFSNTSASPLLITAIGSHAGLTGTYTCHLYAHAATYGVAPGVSGAPISVAGGWSLVATNPSLALTANTTGSGNTATTFISGMSYIVPPLTHIRLCLQLATGVGLPAFTTTAGSLRYSTTAAGVYNFSGGGGTLTTGTGYAWSGTLAAPTFTPRGFIGFLTINSASPCSGTPSPGNTLTTAAAPCTGVAFTLSLQNATAGTGVTYQWQSSPTGLGTWTNFGTNAASQTISHAAATDYRCLVTCGANTGTSNLVAVGLTTGSGCLVYCASSATSAADEEIWNVTLGTLNNSSNCATIAPGPGSVNSMYSNYRSGAGAPAAPNLTQGASVAYSVNVTTCGGAYGNVTAIYIDFNQNGVLTDAGENVFTSASISGTHTMSGNITIPAGATLGNTVMRVVDAEQGTAPACGTYTWGETEDYLVNIVANAACAGTPAPGNTVLTAGSNPTCSGSSITLDLQNATSGSGVTYQWQSADDAGFTVNAANLGTASTQVTSQTAAKYYRCMVTCGANTGTSNSLLVGINSDVCACLSYCASTHTSGCLSGDEMTNVSIATTGLNNSSTCGTGQYTFYNGGGTQTGTMIIGNPYTISVSFGADGSQYFGAWIDYNNDGTFATTEFLGASAAVGAGGTGTVAFTVLGSATTGTHRMRVVGGNDAAVINTNACGVSSSPWGETEDYCVTLNAPAPCSGTPAPGNTLSTTGTLACSAVNFTLSVQNSTTGSGVTYQWQSADDAGFTVNVISMGTAATQVTSQTAPKYYRCLVTCGANTGTSTPINITMGGFAVCGAYCMTPLYSLNATYPCQFNAGITNFQLAGINNTSIYPCAAPFVTFFPGSMATVQQTGTYTMTVTGGQPTYLTSFNMFIDYNDNGSFDDSGEDVIHTGNVAGGTAPYSASFSVPLTAPIGLHRLRIRAADAGTVNSCSVDGVIGEAEDYLVTVTAAPACTGTPAPGNTLTSSNIACASQTITLSLQTATSGTGVTYQWQSSPDGSTWTDFGAGGAIQTATQTADKYYRSLVTCSGNTGTSTPVLVYSSGPCLCTTPVYTSGSGCPFNVYINNVTFAGINNTTGCNGTPPYYKYYNLMATTIPGSVYPLTISNAVTPTVACYYTAYIDYNDNGSFDDAGETIFTSANLAGVASSATTNITIPASPGTHYMRIRCTYAPPVNSCSADGLYGEVEDYKITIGSPAATNNGPVCPGATLNLFASPNGATSYSWSGPDGFTSSLQNPSITNVTNAADGIYTCTVLFGASSFSPTTTVVVRVRPTVTVGNNSPFCSGTASLLLTSTAPTATSYLWTGAAINAGNQASANPVIAAATNAANGTYNLTVTDANGCTNTASTVVGIYALPPVAIIPVGGTNLCIGQTTIDLLGTGAVSYVWSTTETINPITVSAGGTYSVIGTDANTCQNSNSVVITQSSAPALPIVSPSGTITLCADGGGVIPVTLSCTNYSADLSWSTSESTPSISVNYVDLFNVTYTDANGCSSTSADVTTQLDAVAPVITCPADIVTCNPIVSFSAGATDNCSVNTITYVPASGSTFSVGTTPVTATATDFSGNSVSCSFNVTINAPSTAPTGATTTAIANNVCSGTGTTLTQVGGTLGTGGSYKWYTGSCGGSLVGTGSTISVGPLTSTTTYYVRAEGDCGNTACVTITITVSSAPPANTITAVNVPASGCLSTSATVTASTSAGAAFYNWSAPTGLTFGAGHAPSPYQTSTPSVVVNFDALPPTGTSGWSICVFGGNACGTSNQLCSWTRATISTPGTISGAVVACPISSGNYTVPAVSGATSYLWSITGAATVSGTGTTATVTFNGGWTSGVLSVSAQTSCGYTGGARTLAISSIPAVPGLIVGSSSVCPLGSSSYSVPLVTGATSYAWTCNVVGSSIIQTLNNCTITFPASIPAGRTVCVTANSACGASAARCKTIATGVPGTPASIAGPTYGNCAGENIGFSIASMSSATGGYNWTIPTGCSFTGASNTNSVLVNFPANFTSGNVCAQAISTNCGAGAFRCIIVNGYPNVPVITSGNTGPCAGSIEQYCASAANASTYNWTVPTGAVILSGAGTSCILVSWGATGGNITVSATNGCGTSGVRTFAVTISCRQSQLSVAAETFYAEVYPNPSQGKMTVKFSSMSSAKYLVKVQDMTGRVVMSDMVNAIAGINLHEFDLSNVAKGIYMIQIENKDVNEKIRITLE